MASEELELRSRAFQEHRARDCQEIEELRRICCAEADRARQLKMDELSLQQKENPSTVSQLVAQIQEFPDKVNSVNVAREFYYLEAASSSGVSHVTSQPMSIPSPRGMISPRFLLAA